MWYAKIVIPSNEGMLVASRAKKYNISILGYPMTNYVKDRKFYLLATGYIIGNQRNIHAFFKDMRKDPRTIKIDMMSSSFGFWLMEQHPSARIIYDPLIIHVKPFIITGNGEMVIEIASWNKEKIMKVARLLQTKLYCGKLLGITQKKINNINIMTAFPELTGKQKQAFDLAVKHGYYGYPRQISMERLAKIMKVAYSTYEFHLRNAEKKLMPYLNSSIKN